jgi:DNA-binding NtrC family response regulator
MPEESRRRRVLVVDDEALIRWSLTQTLEERGFEVCQAPSASEAVECVSAEDPFDVVLLDFRLPGAAIILMTAYSTPDVAQGALELGAVRVISKPFELHDMASLVGQMA